MTVRSVRLGLAALLLTAATAGAADLWWCHIVVANPTRDNPSCDRTAACVGDHWVWSDRSRCRITCDLEGGSGELIPNGSAECAILADNGEPDCGGWPCL